MKKRPHRLKESPENRIAALGFRTTPSFHEVFKAHAIKKKTTMAILLEKITIKYLKKEGVV